MITIFDTMKRHVALISATKSATLLADTSARLKRGVNPAGEIPDPASRLTSAENRRQKGTVINWAGN